MSALVSIIVPVFNSEKYLVRCLESVQQQFYANWECIIVDDCSTDGSVGIISEFVANDRRFKLIRLDKNSGGPSAPRNAGIRLCIGDWICFLDSDDEWYPDKLDQQLNHHILTGAEWTCTAYRRVSITGSSTLHFPAEKMGYEELIRRNQVLLSSVMFSKKMVSKIKFLNLGHEDFAQWLVLAKSGHYISGVQNPLVTHFRRNNSVSSNKFLVLTFYWRIFRDVLGMSRCIALFVFTRYLVIGFLVMFSQKFANKG